MCIVPLWVHRAKPRHNFRRYGKILPTTDDCSDPDHWIELVEIYRLTENAPDVDPPKTPQKDPASGPMRFMRRASARPSTTVSARRRREKFRPRSAAGTT